jgi:hypothetical protein
MSNTNTTQADGAAIKTTKADFLVFFRRAVTVDTLSVMAEAQERELMKKNAPMSQLANMYLACGEREDEIENNLFTNKKKFQKNKNDDTPWSWSL